MIYICINKASTPRNQQFPDGSVTNRHMDHSAMSCRGKELLLILCAIVTSVHWANGDESYWVKTEVETATLDSETSATYKLQSRIMCASMAMRTPWCHLFAFEDETCRLSSVQVQTFEDQQYEGPTTIVWGRKQTGEIIHPSLSNHFTEYSVLIIILFCIKEQ